jgi:hypothetical protein
MSVDFTKPVQTIGGVPVRILCCDAPGLFPVIGIIGGCHDVDRWTTDGVHINTTRGHRLTLINVPPPKTKMQVEVRLVRTSDGVEAYAKCANGFDVWWPLEDFEEVIASTTIEMEYQP